MRNRILFLLILLVLLLCSCSPSTERCGDKDQDYVTQIEGLMVEFDTSTSKIDDPFLDPILKLTHHNNQMGVFQTMNEIKPPRCAKEAHDKLLSYLALQIEGELSVLTEQDPQYIEETFNKANDEKVQYTQLWNIVAPCGERAPEYFNQIDDYLVNWDDVDGETYKQQEQGISLDESMEKLLGMYFEVNAITPPNCAFNAHTMLTEYMWGERFVFAGFEDDSEQEIEEKIKESQRKREAFDNLWDILKSTSAK